MHADHVPVSSLIYWMDTYIAKAIDHTCHPIRYDSPPEKAAVVGTNNSCPAELTTKHPSNIQLV